MTTLQSLQASRNGAVSACFESYAKRQITSLFCEYEKEEIKKFISKFMNDTKDLNLCVVIPSAKELEENKVNYTIFAKGVPTSINSDGKILIKKDVYCYSFAPQSFADVDKVISYYIDNFSVFKSSSLAFKKELKEKERREEEKKAKKAKEEKITELKNKMYAYVMADDFERVQEIKKEIEELNK